MRLFHNFYIVIQGRVNKTEVAGSVQYTVWRVTVSPTATAQQSKTKSFNQIVEVCELLMTIRSYCNL